MSQRKTLCTDRGEVEVDGRHHGHQEGQGRRSRQEADGEENTTEKFCVIVQCRPQFQGSGQEREVGRHDIVDKTLEFRGSEVGGSEATYRMKSLFVVFVFVKWRERGFGIEKYYHRETTEK